MPVFLPKGFEGSAWDACEKFIAAQEDGAAKFKAAQGRTSAFIIAYWSNGGAVPTHYLCRRRYRKGTVFSRTDFVEFGDETREEDPFQHDSLKATLEMLSRLRQQFGPRYIGLVLWQHPDTPCRPNDKYVRMEEGGEFPGSPRQ